MRQHRGAALHQTTIASAKGSVCPVGGPRPSVPPSLYRVSIAIARGGAHLVGGPRRQALSAVRAPGPLRPDSLGLPGQRRLPQPTAPAPCSTGTAWNTRARAVRLHLGRRVSTSPLLRPLREVHTLTAARNSSPSPPFDPSSGVLCALPALPPRPAACTGRLRTLPALPARSTSRSA